MARLGVVTFVLNEGKFLAFALRSWLDSPHVVKVVVVEGAVRTLAEYATEGGLSIDDTGDVIHRVAASHPRGKLIDYVRLGWVGGKAELQNAGLKRLGKSGADWLLLAGGDEVYTADGLAKLADACNRAPPGKNVLCPSFYHFWRRPDVVCVGSSWSVKMHRVYRMQAGMGFGNHAAPPYRGRSGKLDVPVDVYHYVGMQDAVSIQQKLALYEQRDGHRLNVRDTWSEWEWGKQTQWTHSGGGAERFTGEHPGGVKAWELLPRSVGGELLPVPVVPWDKDLKIGVLTDGNALARDDVKIVVEELVERFDTVIFAPGVVVVAGQKSERFDLRHLEERAVWVSAATVVLRPRGAWNVLVSWRARQPGGFDLIVSPGDVWRLVAALCQRGVGRVAPLRKVSRRISDRRKAERRRRQEEEEYKVAPDASWVGKTLVVGQAAGASGVVTVQIPNHTTEMWTPTDHLVHVVWLDGRYRKPIRNARQSMLPLGEIVMPHETLRLRVQVPEPPATGMFFLNIDIMRRGDRHLGAGPTIPVRAVR